MSLFPTVAVDSKDVFWTDQYTLLREVVTIRNATVEAGMKRIRPCLMTTFTTFIALMPVIYSTGRGSDVAKAMAWPVIGGMAVELLTLFVVPVLYAGIKEFKMNAGMADRHWEGIDETQEPSAWIPLRCSTLSATEDRSDARPSLSIQKYKKTAAATDGRPR